MENKELIFKINEEILIKYVQGALTTEEKQLVEEAMLKDPFIEEAVEGLKLSKNPMVLQDHLSAINESIHTKTGGGHTGIGKTIKLPGVSVKAILAIAASIVILGGTYLIANNFIKNQNQIAQNKKTDNATESAKQEKVLSEQTIIIDKPVVTNEKEEAVDNTLILPVTTKEEAPANTNTYMYDATTVSSGATQNAPSTYNWTLPTAVNKNVDGESNKNIIKGQVVDNKTKKPIAGAKIISGSTNTMTSLNGYYEIALDDHVSEIEITQPGYQDQAKKINAATTKTINIELNQSFESDLAATDKILENKNEESLKQKEVNISDDFKNGINAYTNQEYEKAITSFDKVLQKNPSNIEANYYNGLANINTNKKTKAIIYLNKVIKSNSKYADDAKWQKAQVLIEQNKLNEAKPLLEDLKSNTKYKNQSESILNNNK